MPIEIQERKKQVESMRLKDKVALVTGSSRGIGAAIAMRLGEEGANVAINYSSSREPAEELAQKINELGVKASAFKASVASESEMRELVSQVVKQFGKIDILVNNAGVYEQKPLDQVDLAHYQRLFDVNVKGLITATITALPHISKGGRIINLSSVAATMAYPGGSVYSATKAAVDALTRVWAQDVGPRGITVNAVAPGTTMTDMLESGLDSETKNWAINNTALGRLGETDDIADVVAFLASDDARWITGQSIITSGGLHM
jgi:3-oxoacyl-[acyl-carrier protein] reductase